jgi:lipopolysaccharide transport system permease protein
MPREWDTIIRAGRSEGHYWRDLWRFRELFAFLAWRDTLVRYKQTVFGVTWSVLRPLLTMLVFTVIFGRIAKLPSAGAPYPIMVFAAMLPWQFFANAFSEASNSLIANSNLLTKVYFPRLIVPATSVIVSLIDFLISLVLLVVLMLWYRQAPGVNVLVLPLFLFLVCVIATGAGVFVAALNAKYRDFRFVVPFIVQFGLYVSPVGFSSSVVPEQWRLLYSLNPMVGAIDGFRWSILGQERLDLRALAISCGMAVGLLALGLLYFRRSEREFADTI